MARDGGTIASRPIPAALAMFIHETNNRRNWTRARLEPEPPPANLPDLSSHLTRGWIIAGRADNLSGPIRRAGSDAIDHALLEQTAERRRRRVFVGPQQQNYRQLESVDSCFDLKV